MGCHISNKTAYAEPVPIATEAVKIVTVVDSEKNNVNDDDGGGSSYSKSEDEEDVVEVVAEKALQEEEEIYEGPPEETDKGDVEITGGLQLYKLTDADKTRFTDMVSRHASRA